jgi:hypothetical protein
VPGAKVEKIPGGKGDFVVKAYGVGAGERLLWDKRGRDGGAFPESAQILSQLAGR